MLLTNQCLNKLAAACVDFTDCGMLDGMALATILEVIGVWSQPPILVS